MSVFENTNSQEYKQKFFFNNETKNIFGEWLNKLCEENKHAFTEKELFIIKAPA
jgi:hypothetical protein